MLPQKCRHTIGHSREKKAERPIGCQERSDVIPDLWRSECQASSRPPVVRMRHCRTLGQILDWLLIQLTCVIIIITCANQYVCVCSSVRALGTAAVDMCQVATGGADAYYHIGMHCWDIAASAIIVQEAGGVVTDTDGQYLTRAGPRAPAALSLVRVSPQARSST